MLAPGALVRLTDQAALGRLGTVVGEPRREYLVDGSFGDTIEVELTTGGRQRVRTPNLEVVASAPR